MAVLEEIIFLGVKIVIFWIRFIVVGVICVFNRRLDVIE